MHPIVQALHVVEVSPADALPGAPTVLLSHGYGCDQGMWQDVLPLLPRVRKVLFDFPGAGTAAPEAYDPDQHATLQGYADTLVQLIEALDLHDVVYVGHSVASMIGALAALQVPERFRSMVMVSPSPCYLNDPPDYMGGFEPAELQNLLDDLAEGHAAWSRAIAPLIMGNADRPALAGRLAESFSAMDPSIAVRWARVTFLSDLRSVIPQLEVPCVVLQCRHDVIAPMAVGEWLHRHLPRSHLVTLNATGHCPHVSHPAEVARVIDETLAWPD